MYRFEETRGIKTREVLLVRKLYQSDTLVKRSVEIRTNANGSTWSWRIKL